MPAESLMGLEVKRVGTIDEVLAQALLTACPADQAEKSA